MELLSAGTCATQPEGRLLQMAENLLSRRVVPIDVGDHLFNLMGHQSA